MYRRHAADGSSARAAGAAAMQESIVRSDSFSVRYIENSSRELLNSRISTQFVVPAALRSIRLWVRPALLCRFKFLPAAVRGNIDAGQAKCNPSRNCAPALKQKLPKRYPRLAVRNYARVVRRRGARPTLSIRSRHSFI